MVGTPSVTLTNWSMCKETDLNVERIENLDIQETILKNDRMWNRRPTVMWPLSFKFFNYPVKKRLFLYITYTYTIAFYVFLQDRWTRLAK